MENKVKEKRLELKLTQEELAKEAGISRNVIIQIENGHDLNLTKSTMQSIAVDSDKSHPLNSKYNLDLSFSRLKANKKPFGLWRF